MTAVIRYGFCPLMLLGVNGVGLWLVASGASKWWLLALLGGAIGLSFAALFLFKQKAPNS